MASSGTSNGGNSREYCLRWSNHGGNMVSFFGGLYSTESFVDVTLVSSEGRKVLAHKLVLSACSPYFQHVFENNPCKHPVVILKDVNLLDLQSIVKFMYNGEVNISHDRMDTVLQTANVLQVKGLAEVPADELRRVSTAVAEPVISNVRSINPNAPLLHSSSWDPSDGHDIPKKKFKKSASAASYMGSLSTNGEHSSSIDSGVGTSVSRSMDEPSTNSSSGGDDPISFVQKRSSLPAPPPLLPKSKSLDHNLQRDSSEDCELTQTSRQSYDDSSVGVDRGYDVEVAEDDMEEDYSEEYYDYVDGILETEYCDPETGGYVDYDNNIKSSNAAKSSPLLSAQLSKSLPNTMKQIRSDAKLEGMRPDVVHVSSAAGERRRRGRPLLRQPRIKRGDNDGGSGKELFGNEFYTRDTINREGVEVAESSVSPVESPNDMYDERSVSPGTLELQRPSLSNLPIVRVSQCSPTPPSSPTSASPVRDDVKPVIVTNSLVRSSSMSKISALQSTVITPASSSTTLLSVPNSESLPVPFMPSNGCPNQLVKQISQPLLPSHCLTHTGSITSGNPVIRRQNSSPATHLQPSRIINPAHSAASTTVFQVLPPTDKNSGDDTKTYIIDVIPSSSNTDACKEDQFVKISVSKEGVSALSSASSYDRSINSQEEPVPQDPLKISFDDELPVNRSGHCPALRPGPALGCNFCWNSVDSCGRILRRKTKYHCPECHINLCIVPCFQEYHEKSDKKKKPRGKLGLPKPSSM